MKKFLSLGKVLSKNEQKQISGADGGGTGDIRTMICINGSGCLHYPTPTSYSQCQLDIATYCSSGQGGCFTIYVDC